MASSRLVVALAGVLLLLSACGGSSGAASTPGAAAAGFVDPDGMAGSVIQQPYQLPARTLTDQEGRRFDTGELTAPLTLVFFGYTHCPDICQAVMADITAARARLTPTEADQIGMVFVTTDPARDDAAVLEEYLGRFDPGYVGLTGSLEDIEVLAAGLKVYLAEGRTLPSGGYEVDHGTAIMGVRPDGSVPILWTEGTSASRLAADLRLILTDPSVLDSAGAAS